ncbi:hypothetical protein HDU96_002451 [Phlyctochytrium bullatum]|nr:hypothetical protein HDU96_002451 [Phlyctochytrium bullatum]
MATLFIFLALALFGLQVSSQVTTLSTTDVNNLRLYAQFSQLSYCASSANFRAFNCPICGPPAAGGFTSIRPIISRDRLSQGYVAVDHTSKAIVFSFQGAVNMENWASSLLFPRVSFDVPGADANAWVHVGFYNAYKSMKSFIIGNVTAAIRANPTYKLHAIGHSYGCSLATYATAELILTRAITGPMVEMSIFGCPRLGNFEFARMMDTTLKISRIRRVVHSSDRIVRVPPTPTGYRHFGDEMWMDITNKRTLLCKDVVQGLDESPSCVNSLSFASLGINPHNSYWDRLASTACGPQQNPPVVVRYLPYEVFSTRT